MFPSPVVTWYLGYRLGNRFIQAGYMIPAKMHQQQLSVTGATVMHWT